MGPLEKVLTKQRTDLSGRIRKQTGLTWVRKSSVASRSTLAAMQAQHPCRGAAERKATRASRRVSRQRRSRRDLLQHDSRAAPAACSWTPRESSCSCRHLPCLAPFCLGSRRFGVSDCSHSSDCDGRSGRKTCEDGFRFRRTKSEAHNFNLAGGHVEQAGSSGTAHRSAREQRQVGTPSSGILTPLAYLQNHPSQGSQA